MIIDHIETSLRSEIRLGISNRSGISISIIISISISLASLRASSR
jgi:hypothetical protein